MGRVKTNDNLRIVLDSPAKDVYSAGDRICGRVCFASEEDEDVGKVVVNFWGRSKTKVYRRDGYGNRMTFRGRGYFFYETVVLYEGQYTHKAPKFEWPFEFQFPEKAKHTTIGNNFKRKHASFRRSDQLEDLSLPSTMATRGHAIRVVHSFDAHVEYKLEASMTNPGANKAQYESEFPLPFMQLSATDSGSRSNDLSISKSFEVRSYKLDPQTEGASLSFLEKAKSAFGSDSVPFTNFQVTMNAPATIRLGDPVALTLELNNISKSESLASTPPVSLQSIEVSIISHTSARAGRNFIKPPENTSDDEISCDIGLRANPDSWSGPFEKGTAYTKQLPLDPLASIMGIVPSFAACNIVRRYKLKTRCVFECAGKQVKFQRQDPIEILPGLAQNADELAQYVEKAPSIAGSVSSLADTDFGDSTENLPCYEEANDDLPPAVAEAQAPSRSEKPGLQQQ